MGYRGLRKDGTLSPAKSSQGNFFEDFRIGQTLRHSTPRTLTEGDNALYIALIGERYPLWCSGEFARRLGLEREPVNDLLVFHVVFGKSVPDISLNGVANLGYAAVRFLRRVYPADTLRAESTVLGMRESSTGDTGVLWVQTRGFNQHEEPVLEFYRWVLLNKHDRETRLGIDDAPALPTVVTADALPVPSLRVQDLDTAATGGRFFFEDYETGERIDHIDGVTIEEAEHALATRLYQNTARVHFNALEMQTSRFGRRLIYGGHVISIARALSFNGLENALGMLAWNGGTHSNPTFAGDTIYAWSEILEMAELPGSDGLGALRTRLVGVKNVDPRRADVPLRVQDERGREVYHSSVVLDLDYWLLMPKRR